MIAGAALVDGVVFVVPLAVGLILTLGIEVGVAHLMGYSSSRQHVAVVAVNLITNPFAAWLTYFTVFLFAYSASLGLPKLFQNPWWTIGLAVAVIEITVVIIEWLLLRWALGSDSKRALLVSATMNTASFLAGIALYGLASVLSR
jgi:hypothetical protein